jgi:hypothetical protein
MLYFFSCGSFYATYVRLPGPNSPVPALIRDNPRFWPFLKDALGAIDGTKFPTTVSAAERAEYLDRRGVVCQNSLIGCSFDFRFTYMLTGWPGSEHDASMYGLSRTRDLARPEGKYYLADAGFPVCEELLVPYRGVRYHLSESGDPELR